jgi:hypothetical protein
MRTQIFGIWKHSLKAARLAGCVLASALIVPVISLYADGTKQLLSDAGLYSGEPAGTAAMNIFTWTANGSLAINAESPTNNAPEGLNVATATVPSLWGGWGIFNVVAGGSYTTTMVDYSDYTGGSVRFWLNSQNELEFQIEYLTGDGFFTDSKVTQVLPATAGLWQEIVIPLDSLSSSDPTGLCLTNIVGPFLLSTSDNSGATGASKTYLVDDVRWTKPLAGLAVYPTNTSLNPGQHRLFTIEGVSREGEPILVYAPFSASASVGNLVASSGAAGLSTSAVLAGGPSSGSVTAVSTNPSPNTVGTATVAATQQNLQQEFGVLGEGRTNVAIHVNAQLLAFSGGGASNPAITNSTPDTSYDTKSFLTTVVLKTAGSYAGWSVQLGTNSPSTNTVDMSAYYDGNLRFSLLAPAALASAITVGMRSANVQPGNALSVVNLTTNYATFDTNWHEVVIPISVFAGARPWADLSRMQDLFTISVSGAVGTQTFLIDNVRWETGITDTNSGLQFTLPTRAGENLQLTLLGPPGLAANVEFSTNAIHWMPLFDGLLVLNSDGLQVTHTNAVSLTNVFYHANAKP